MKKIKNTIPFAIVAVLMVAATIVNAASPEREKVSPERQKARYYYLEGLRRQMADEPDAAYEYYKRAKDLDPSYTEAASAYGTQRLAAESDTMQTRTELSRSLSYMRPFVDRYPDEYNEALYYAYVAARVDSIKEAIRVFERTAERRPDLSSTLVHLSEAYMADGNIDKALEALSRYETIEGYNPQITIKKISYHLARRDTVGALSEASALVDYNPVEPAYRILKGNLFEMANMPDSTLTYYEEAERLNPDYGAAKLALANYYRQQETPCAMTQRLMKRSFPKISISDRS